MKILIVDDHELIRSGLANLLSQHKYDVVAEAATSSQALALINTHKPEIVLVDINLGSSSGIDLIKEMKKSGSKSKFVVLTMQISSNTSGTIITISI